jgi:hypothetical protein
MEYQWIFFFKVFGHRAVPFFCGVDLFDQRFTVFAQTPSAVLGKSNESALAGLSILTIQQVLHSPAFHQSPSLTTGQTITEKTKRQRHGCDRFTSTYGIQKFQG